MGMREEFESAGNWLFRRRGYLPLLLFPLVLYAAWHSPDRTIPGASWNAPVTRRRENATVESYSLSSVSTSTFVTRASST